MSKDINTCLETWVRDKTPVTLKASGPPVIMTEVTVVGVTIINGEHEVLVPWSRIEAVREECIVDHGEVTE